LLPVIAGIAYELIRFAGKHQSNRLLMALLAPGLWLQRLTTRQPTLDQIEVSIRALREVLDREESAAPSAAARVEVMGWCPATGFHAAVDRADAGCPISTLIRCSAAVSVAAQLAG